MNEGTRDCGRASNGRYVKGCRCDACRHAHVMAWKARELRNLTGETYFVDAAPVRKRLLALYAMGYSKREIERFGVSGSTQYALTRRHNRSGKPLTRVRRQTAEKLEAVSGRRLSRGQRVPADAARLMVDGWADAGVPVARISRVTGLDRQVLDGLRHGRRTQVKAETLLALLDHREELDDLTRPEPRRSYADTLSATHSDWEIEQAYAERKAGTPIKSLAERLGMDGRQLRRLFNKIERREAAPCRA